MIEKYPSAMLIKYRWGEVPLTYALFSKAPIKVIYFLLETYIQTWKAMPFDFGLMILRLATKRGTSADYVRDVIWAQRIHHCALEINWQQIVDDSIRLRHYIPIKMFTVLVEASISKRSICMSEDHQSKVGARLNRIDFVEWTIKYYEKICDLVASFVQLHHRQLKKLITILELALWNAMICSKVDDQESRNESCISGGWCFEVVIKNVLAFL